MSCNRDKRVGRGPTTLLIFYTSLTHLITNEHHELTKSLGEVHSMVLVMNKKLRPIVDRLKH